MLHARRLALPHPTTGEPLVIESPIPEDFAAVLASLRRRWE
jgi:23S rRNA pseudouridine1911/1915/1917 synthase